MPTDTFFLYDPARCFLEGAWVVPVHPTQIRYGVSLSCQGSVVPFFLSVLEGPFFPTSERTNAVEVRLFTATNTSSLVFLEAVLPIAFTFNE